MLIIKANPFDYLIKSVFNLQRGGGKGEEIM